MRHLRSRRQFLGGAAGAAGVVGLGGLDFLAGLRSVSAAEARLDPGVVRFGPEIEPLVRLFEETPRDRLLEEVGVRIRRGLSYREVLTGLLLAGVRNIQPRPVGFKFHAVLVVNSAHLASLAAPDSERWLPIFWALDYFKQSQADDVREGDWSLRAVDEGRVPSVQVARRAFIDAMEAWDEEAADRAVVGLVRSVGAQELFALMCRYGARDFRDIGHKAIYVANSWRTLQSIGWQHAEPVMRSLVYALLDRGRDGNPAEHDYAADRPGRRNLEIRGGIRTDWLAGAAGSEATEGLLEHARSGAAIEAGEAVVSWLNRGVAPASIWDGIFAGACERLMRDPGIITLHAVTCANALHYAWQHCSDDSTRRFLLLQAAAFLPLFRRREGSGVRIDQLEAAPMTGSAGDGLEEIFAEITRDRLSAARKTFGWLKAHSQAGAFVDRARLLVFFKGRNSHDYKFSAAVLEDYAHIGASWRDRFLAASVFNLPGSGVADNDLVRRTRAALGSI
jgi:hypothetical protein